MQTIEREERHELLDSSRASTEWDHYEFKDKAPVYHSVLTPGLKKGLTILAVINVTVLSVIIAIAIRLRRGTSTDVNCAASTSFYCELIIHATHLVGS